MHVAILTLLSYVSSAIEDSVNQLARHQDEKERRVITDWLTPIDYAPQQSDFIARREKGTGRWLLDSSEFQKWLNQSKQTLFCPGMPGAGKTILTSIVIEHLYAKFQNDASVGIAYLYCNFQQQQSPTDLLASLLKQLIQERPSMPEIVKNLYEHHKDKRTRPSFDEISNVLHSVVANYSRAFIIIDALDELLASDKRHKKFLSEIFNLQAKARASVFATSRFVPEIVREFEGSISLEIRASDGDVQRYLDGRMSQLSLCVSRNVDLQETIKAEIIKAVNGMYVPPNASRVD
jgi:Cdc6-like AAA superfamily ATPase